MAGRRRRCAARPRCRGSGAAPVDGVDRSPGPLIVVGDFSNDAPVARRSPDGAPAAFDAMHAYRTAVAFSSAGVIVETADGRIADVNAAAAALLGFEPDELVGRPYALLCVGDERTAHAALRAALRARMHGGDVADRRFVRKDGETVQCSTTIALVPPTSGGHAFVTVLHGAGGTEDARGAKERLDALGLFAGGVAHDFNNVLSIIRCNAEFAREALGTRTPDLRAAIADLGEVERAADRATALVRQLLAFGRRQPRDPRRMDLNAVVRGAVSLLRVSIDANIQVVLRLASDLPAAHADQSQVEQVLMNLVLNARDAITEALAESAAGASQRLAVLTIATAAEHVGPDAVGRIGVPSAGDYIRLDVRDTGVGMTDATRARIFEPFFTTKPVGAGTGLGLAATWGIVVQSGGSIRVESERMTGTTFRVYFPVASVELPDAEETRAPTPTMPDIAPVAPHRAPVDGAARTVLLAEDDHAVRRVASRILRSAGYRVLEAGDGGSALDLWNAHAEEIDVLVADVRMPRLRGDALAAIVTGSRPDLPVVLMTGFGDEPGGLEGAPMAPSAGMPPLAKPFASAALLDRVAAALEASAVDAPDASASVDR